MQNKSAVTEISSTTPVNSLIEHIEIPQKINKQKKKFSYGIFLAPAWLALSSIVAVVVSALLIVETSKPNNHQYNLYSAKPLVLGTMTSGVLEGDARAAKIDEVFSKYNCPLAGMGSKFVEEADKNGIPYWIVASISFQESSCGKLTPEPDGVESYNAWGWGVYGDNIFMFDNWGHGIEVVSKYINDRFYSQGRTELCDIMKTYTPPSQGSWCAGVEHFKEIIHEFQSPLGGL